MNRRLVLIATILLPLGLAGCGNKGPLVLSEPPAETPVPAEQSEPAPATEPAATDPVPPADASGTPAA